MSRRLDLSKFRGSDSEDEDDPGTSKRGVELNALKSKTFSHGITKKTKKDLEKEAEEKKRVEEEKAAALVYAEYAEAFDGPDVAQAPLGGTRGGGGFSGFRGRPVGPGGGFVRAGGGPGPQMPYDPPRGPAAMGYARPARAPSPPPTSGPKPKGKRAMDAFLEEIKKDQEAREARLGHVAKLEGSSVTALAAWEREKGGRPLNEGETTNLFISNLPSNITEESFGLFFAKMGPVGTVKIMWPRGDEDFSVGASISTSRRNKAGLSGFVSYMKRADAEKCKREYDGMDWGGSVLRVGWGKAVPMPLKAIYDLTQDRQERRGRSRSPERKHPSKRRDRSLSSSRSRSPPRKRSRSKSPRRRRRDSYSSASSRSDSRSRSRSYTPPPKRLSAREKWLSQVPAEQEKFLRAVATRVKEHGKAFEELLKEREKGNDKFKFLFNEDLPEYHLYRSCLDSRYRIPTPPPDDFEDTGYASLFSSDSAEDSEKERTAKGKLGKLARKRLEAILRAMSGKRVEIARAMEFAMKRAEAAEEVADVICQSLRLDGTPIPRKMARLHLISDILHNSASPLPNVWKYRHAFETALPKIFAHLSGVYSSLLAYSGRISADVFKQQVVAVLTIWERWIVFNPDVSDTLRALLDGTKSLESLNVQASENAAEKTAATAKVEQTADKAGEDKFKKSGFKSSFVPLASAAPTVADDLDGEAMEDVDGEAMDENLDGEAMVEDVDGEAMDEDVDGEAM